MKKIGNVLSWATDLEENTLEQAQRTAALPFVRGHLALMPDAHLGFGATIGSVVATQGAIVPSAVGVDIGCGMIAAETDLSADGLPDDGDRFLRYVEAVVPAGVGKGHARRPDLGLEYVGMPRFTAAGSAIPEDLRKKAVNQFGSLGGGNHFLELCLDERDRVWIVLHSGSRGVGKELAERHIKTAKRLMKKWFIDLDDPELAYLVQGTPEFDAYILDMIWAQEYAVANREAMMDAALEQLWGWARTSAHSSEHGVGREVSRVNCHHNYCVRENHRGQDVWLTRKGAIRARVGDVGVIPGSMGARSFIVAGLGNPASYQSCSHGAGRRMSRKRARAEVTIEQFTEAMGDRAWLRERADELLDEAPAAYKDVEAVMDAQRDLVTVEHELRQIVNYKGVS